MERRRRKRKKKRAKQKLPGLRKRNQKAVRRCLRRSVALSMKKISMPEKFLEADSVGESPKRMPWPRLRNARPKKKKIDPPSPRLRRASNRPTEELFGRKCRRCGGRLRRNS